MSTKYYVSRLVSADMLVNIISGVIFVKSCMMFCIFVVACFFVCVVRLRVFLFCIGDAMNLFFFFIFIALHFVCELNAYRPILSVNLLASDRQSTKLGPLN